MRFIEIGGPNMVIKKIVRQDQSIDILELCLGSIKQLANTKITFNHFLRKNKESSELLPSSLFKCLSISDNWFQETKHLKLFKKIFAGKKEELSKTKQLM